jgi:hypothetical protein
MGEEHDAYNNRSNIATFCLRSFLGRNVWGRDGPKNSLAAIYYILSYINTIAGSLGPKFKDQYYSIQLVWNTSYSAGLSDIPSISRDISGVKSVASASMGCETRRSKKSHNHHPASLPT